MSVERAGGRTGGGGGEKRTDLALGLVRMRNRVKFGDQELD